MFPLIARNPYGFAASFKPCASSVFGVLARHKSRKSRPFIGKQRKPKEHKDHYNELKKKKRMIYVMKEDLMELKSRERYDREIDVPYHVSSINQILSHYVPLEPFAKAPIYTRLGLEQRYEESVEKFRIISSRYSVWRRLSKIDPLNWKKFAKVAQKKLIDANRAQERDDKEAMRDLLTINVCEEIKERKNKVIWKFVKELEPPRLVNCRTAAFNSEDNVFAQITARFNIRQVHAEYDEVGKLIKGDPNKTEDVLAYVVFERPLKFASTTPWKICGKLPSQIPWKTVQEALKQKRLQEKRKQYKTQADQDRYREEFERSRA